jgi:hypothetical protein
MKKTSLSILLIVAFSLILLSACGGGSSSTSQPQPQTTTAVMTLSTSVTGSIPAGTTINSYNVTVSLPSGVTVSTEPNSPVTSTGVATALGNAPEPYGVYTAATGTFPGMVKIYVDSANGFAIGDFCELSVTVAAGLSVSPSDFNVTLDDATGFDPVAVSTILNLHTQLSVTIK